MKARSKAFKCRRFINEMAASISFTTPASMRVQLIMRETVGFGRGRSCLKILEPTASMVTVATSVSSSLDTTKSLQSCAPRVAEKV